MNDNAAKDLPTSRLRAAWLVARTRVIEIIGGGRVPFDSAERCVLVMMLGRYTFTTIPRVETVAARLEKRNPDGAAALRKNALEGRAAAVLFDVTEGRIGLVYIDTEAAPLAAAA